MAVASIDYHEIPGFPVSTVAGHNGRFVFGLIGDTKVVIMQGAFITMKVIRWRMSSYQFV